jgi:hypothetical protein
VELCVVGVVGGELCVVGVVGVELCVVGVVGGELGVVGVFAVAHCVVIASVAGLVGCSHVLAVSCDLTMSIVWKSATAKYVTFACSTETQMNFLCSTESINNIIYSRSV